MNFRSIGSRLCKAALVLAALMAVSCSDKSGSLLDTVPASAPMVASVDLGTVMKRAGCRTGNDGIVLTPQVAALLGCDSDAGEPAPPVKALVGLSGCVDMSNMVAYGYNAASGRTAVTFRIDDREGFDKNVAGLGATATSAGGADYYEMDGWTLAAMGDQGWMAPESVSGMVAVVSEAMAVEAAESVSSLDGITDFLGGNSAVKVAVKQAESWLCVSVKLEDPVIGAHLQVMSGDGEVKSVAAGLKHVDTGCLRYMPDNSVLVAAIGCAPGFDWSPVRAVVGAFLGPEAALNMQFVEPFLTKIDGTVAFAAGPAGGAPAIADINYHTWDFTFMAYMPQTEVDKVLTMVNMYGGQLGMKSVAVDDNITELRLPDGANIYVGNVDGYMMVSTRRPALSASEGAMVDMFQSKPGAVVLNVPAGSEIVKAFELPCGFDCSIQLADDYLHGRLSLNGSDSSVLEVLLGEMVRD